MTKTTRTLSETYFSVFAYEDGTPKGWVEDDLSGNLTGGVTLAERKTVRWDASITSGFDAPIISGAEVTRSREGGEESIHFDMIWLGELAIGGDGKLEPWPDDQAQHGVELFVSAARYVVLDTGPVMVSRWDNEAEGEEGHGRYLDASELSGTEAEWARTIVSAVAGHAAEVADYE